MKKFAIEIKWAIVFAIASLLWMEVEKITGLHDVHIDKHLIYSNLFAIVAIAIYIFALVDKKKHFFHGNMSWPQGFVSGVIISFIITLLSPLLQYLTFTYITPDFFANSIQNAVENSGMPLEKAESYFNLKSYIIQATFGGLSMGIITSAVVALFVKTKINPAVK